jgi:hypothetical protein
MRTDFPHSGNSDDIKMLGNWTSETTAGGFYYTTVTVSSTNLDAVCKRCHPGIGVRH